LFEGQEFEDAGVDGGVESKAALVGAESAAELEPEATVDLNLAAVVEPGNAEHNLAFWLDEAFEDFSLDVFRMAVKNRAEAIEDLLDGLEKFGLVGVTLGNLFIYALDMPILGHLCISQRQENMKKYVF
jgi:hypothetical protein